MSVRSVSVRRVRVTPLQVEVPLGAIEGKYSPDEIRQMGKMLIQAADLAADPRSIPNGAYDFAAWEPMYDWNRRIIDDMEPA